MARSGRPLARARSLVKIFLHGRTSIYKNIRSICFLSIDLIDRFLLSGQFPYFFNLPRRCTVKSIFAFGTEEYSLRCTRFVDYGISVDTSIFIYTFLYPFTVITKYRNTRVLLIEFSPVRVPEVYNISKKKVCRVSSTERSRWYF